MSRPLKPPSGSCVSGKGRLPIEDEEAYGVNISGPGASHPAKGVGKGCWQHLSTSVTRESDRGAGRFRSNPGRPVPAHGALEGNGGNGTSAGVIESVQHVMRDCGSYGEALGSRDSTSSVSSPESA